MRTRTRILKDAYPILLLITLLMTWGLEIKGISAAQATGSRIQREWAGEKILRGPPVCPWEKRQQLPVAAGTACVAPRENLSQPKLINLKIRGR